MRVEICLLQSDVGNFEFRSSLVPLPAYMLKDQSERLSLAGRQGRSREINRIRVGAAGLQNLDGHVFYLRNLTIGIPEGDPHHRMRNHPVPEIRDAAINVGYTGAHKILRLAHLDI